MLTDVCVIINAVGTIIMVWLTWKIYLQNK